MKRRKRSAFVPRSVLGASFSAVVPACVLMGAEACSSGPPVMGVAAVAYCCFEAGVAADAFGGDAASDAPSESNATDAPADAPDDGSGDGSEGG